MATGEGVEVEVRVLAAAMDGQLVGCGQPNPILQVRASKSLPVHHRVRVRQIPEWSILGCQSLNTRDQGGDGSLLVLSAWWGRT